MSTVSGTQIPAASAPKSPPSSAGQRPLQDRRAPQDHQVLQTPPSSAGAGRNTRVLAKWKTPADELLGIGKLADALVQRLIAEPRDICIAVPSNTWALQMHRACRQLGIKTTLCIPHTRLKGDDAAALARLDALAQVGQGERAATSADLADFVKRYAGVKGFAAVRACGLTERPVFEHALLHVIGDEDAATLSALIHGQLERPTLTPEALEIPIMHYRHIDRAFRYAFLVGCVDGLIPEQVALACPDQSRRDRAIQQSRDAFFALLDGTEVRIVASYFTEMPADDARRARIPFLRCKQERGVTMAMLRPTRFVAEMGAARPTTTGGQVLLRDYDLN
jgi:hypothetical protein